MQKTLVLENNSAYINLKTPNKIRPIGEVSWYYLFSESFLEKVACAYEGEGGGSWAESFNIARGSKIDLLTFKARVYARCVPRPSQAAHPHVFRYQNCH